MYELQNPESHKCFANRFSTKLPNALIHLTDKIRQQIHKENFDNGIFFDFQNTFDTVNHNTLIQKLNYYGVRGTANKNSKIEINI